MKIMLAHACDCLDKSRLLQEVPFVAAKLDRLPKCGPDELNLYSITERQISADVRITALHQMESDMESSSTAGNAASKVYEIDVCAKKPDLLSSQITAQLEHVQRVCSATAMLINVSRKLKGSGRSWHVKSTAMKGNSRTI
jgi:hypothetical protein